MTKIIETSAEIKSSVNEKRFFQTMGAALLPSNLMSRSLSIRRKGPQASGLN